MAFGKMPRVISGLALAGGVLLAAYVGASGAETDRRPFVSGLIATYSDGEHSLTRRAHTPNFVLGDDDSIHPQLGQQFTLTYDGVIRILAEDDYAFGASTPYAVITINGQPADQIHLTPGDHAFRVEYTRPAGQARLQLTWSSSTFPTEPIPSSALGHVESPAAFAEADLVDRGRRLVQDFNCLSCHATTSPALANPPGPDLSTAGARLRPQWIAAWLENPKAFRPTAHMPVVLHDEQDRRDVATYLATLGTADAAPASFLPESIEHGQRLFETIGCVNCHGTTGTSLNGMATKWTSADALSAYLRDPIAAHPSGRMPSMLLDEEQADALAAFLLTASTPDEKPAGQASYAITNRLPAFEAPVAPGDAEHGKSVVTSAGCLSCHALVTTDATRLTPAATPPPPALESLRLSGGCLAHDPTDRAPRYTFSEDERQAITVYLTSLSQRPEVATAPTVRYQEHIQQFNCIACHTAEGFAEKQTLDGVPPLAIAGQKLRPEWIHSVLTDKRRVRPWLPLRMPHFGPAVEPLVDELVAVSGSGPVEDTPIPGRREMRDGRRIVGKGHETSFSCITCHAYNGSLVVAPEQSRGPELTLMAERLRPGWFERWMHQPSRIIPGTVMPTFFHGKAPAESLPTIQTIWGYLSLGRTMPPPEGSGEEGTPRFVLSATDGPVVQRCILDNRPPRRRGNNGGEGEELEPIELDERKARYAEINRAVAVGLPGSVSFVFDAEAGHLAYAWSGGFLDMTGGWNGRGDSRGRPIGQVFYLAPLGSPIYLDSLDRSPELDYTGYEFVNGQLDLLYTVDDVPVRERVTVASDGRSLVRTFELDPGDREVFFVFADDPAVTITAPPDRTDVRVNASPSGWQSALPARAVRVEANSPIRFSLTISVPAAAEVTP